MSNEVAASSSQDIMDNHLSHSDEVVKDINNYDEVDNTNGDEVVDQSEIILDQASDNEGDKYQKENDNNMHFDFGDLVSSMDGNNFSYDEDTNYVTVNREIIIRFDKVDVKYYPGSFIMPGIHVFLVTFSSTCNFKIEVRFVRLRRKLVRSKSNTLILKHNHPKEV